MGIDSRVSVVSVGGFVPSVRMDCVMRIYMRLSGRMVNMRMSEREWLRSSACSDWRTDGDLYHVTSFNDTAKGCLVTHGGVSVVSATLRSLTFDQGAIGSFILKDHLKHRGQRRHLKSRRLAFAFGELCRAVMHLMLLSPKLIAPTSIPRSSNMLLM